MARAPRAVPVQGAGKAVAGGSCPSAFPATVACSAYLARGGVAQCLRPLALLGVTRPPAGRPAFVCWLCALWGRHEGAWGRRLSPGCGDAFRWGAWPRDAAVDTHKQAGRQSTALTGASSRSCHVTKRFRILATLKQGNKSFHTNTSGYVHMGLRLDWGKGITGQ